MTYELSTIESLQNEKRRDTIDANNRSSIGSYGGDRTGKGRRGSKHEGKDNMIIRILKAMNRINTGKFIPESSIVYSTEYAKFKKDLNLMSIRVTLPHVVTLMLRVAVHSDV